MPVESVRATSRWVTRLIPVILAAAVGYTTWCVVAHICVDRFIYAWNEHGTAVAILVFYFIFLLLMIVTYVRTINQIITDPGLVPLGPRAVSRRRGLLSGSGGGPNDNSNNNGEKRAASPRGEPDLEARPYIATGPDLDPDSPGLEQFYSRDVFVCENDGRPKWCSECCTWKPDRAHHSSEVDRCVLRMDHYCPWVGGMVGENSFKFFTQFTMYTACYCAVVLGAGGSAARKQMRSSDSYPDAYIIAVLVLASFFGLFTVLMTITSWRYIALNMTNIDMMQHSSKVYQLAVRVPCGTQPTEKYQVVTYPLSPNGRSDRLSQPAPPLARDALATRTFAILKLDPSANPWDLGLWRNWQQVMGRNPLDWFLPLHKSPCAVHDPGASSFYPMGYVEHEVRVKYALPSSEEMDETDRIEMRRLQAEDQDGRPRTTEV